MAGGWENGVTDGARTRDNQNHNLGLYQLSYGHHLQRERAEKIVHSAGCASEKISVYLRRGLLGPANLLEIDRISFHQGLWT